MDRSDLIKQRLQAAFAPDSLQVIDDSELHKGHAGSRNGAGHYTVIIQAACFKHKSRLAAHREVYALLSDLIPTQIHALQIKITIE